LKYSGCTEISINANLTGKTLEITLYDNGKGFDISNDFNGNGLVNMKARAENIGGSLRIQSSLETGSMIKFVGKIK
jgi:signal transduction histidine kinase